MRYLIAALLLATSPAMALDTNQQVIVVYQSFPPVIELPEEPATEFKPTVIVGLSRPSHNGVRHETFRLTCLAGCEHTGGDN